MDLLPIGSILRLPEEEKAIVLGYTLDTKKNKFTYCYIVGSYPLGFMDSKSLFQIPVDADVGVVYKGYRSKGFPVFIHDKQKLYELTKTMTSEEFNLKMKEALNALDAAEEK